MVFYRKYRPQTIDQLDNQQVRETLIAVLEKSVPHAFLFTGPKGLGKTSTARIVAKAINCERNVFVQNQESRIKNQGKKTNDQGLVTDDSIEPCNSCEQCLSIMKGTNLDVIEIDAASNRGIDEIRELKEKINLTPVQSRKKVYIIDEVHMLTTEAFNALLKTLEEPPEHAIFILCTTEQHKVPATILSRCFHISFQPATIPELVRSFKRIVVGEHLSITDEALLTLAAMSEGGFRDGTKLLEEIVALAKDLEITKELVEEKLHVAGLQKQIGELLTHLQKKDAKAGLAIIAGLVEQKTDIQYFLQQILTLLHELLLQEIEGKSEKLKVKRDLPAFTIEEIQKLSQLLSEAYMAGKQAVIPQFPLELAIIEWCFANSESRTVNNEQNIKNIAPIADIAVKLDRNKNTVLTVKPEEAIVSVSSLRKQVGEIAKEKALYGEKKEEEVAVDPIVMTSVSLLHFSKDGEITKEWLETFWKCLISEMKNYNHTIAGVLRSCRIASFDRKNLTIEAAYQFHKDKLGDGKTMAAIEQLCKTLIGSPIVVTIVLKGK